MKIDFNAPSLNNKQPRPNFSGGVILCVQSPGVSCLFLQCLKELPFVVVVVRENCG